MKAEYHASAMLHLSRFRRPTIRLSAATRVSLTMMAGHNTVQDLYLRDLCNIDDKPHFAGRWAPAPQSRRFSSLSQYLLHRLCHNAEALSYVTANLSNLWRSLSASCALLYSTQLSMAVIASCT